MGESAAKEYYADQAAAAADRKLGAQRRRLKMLEEMFRGPGFGQHDGRHQSLVEQKITESLQFAFEALSVITR